MSKNRIFKSYDDMPLHRTLSTAREITPERHEDWTVLVQVLEGRQKQLSKEKNYFRRLVLVDSEGTRISGVIFNNHIDHFNQMFKPFKRYYVSNALLSVLQDQYKISDYAYAWQINKRTLVEEHEEEIPPSLDMDFEFTSFEKVHRYADSDILINVRGMVVKCFPPEPHNQFNVPSMKRNILLINEEERLLLLTLWDSFSTEEGQEIEDTVDKNPLLFALRVKVSTFNGISLSTRNTSGLLLNPPVHENLQLSKWLEKKKDDVQQLVLNKSYKNTDILIPSPKQSDIISIEELSDTSKPYKCAWIEGELFFPPPQKTMTFRCCGNCSKAIDLNVSWKVTCPTCKVYATVGTVTKLDVQITDSSSTITTTIGTPDIEQLIPFTAEQLRQHESNDKDLYRKLADCINGKQVSCFVRWYTVTFQRRANTRYSTMKLYKKKNVATDKYLGISSNDITDNQFIYNAQNDEKVKTDIKRKSSQDLENDSFIANVTDDVEVNNEDEASQLQLKGKAIAESKDDTEDTDQDNLLVDEILIDITSNDNSHDDEASIPETQQDTAKVHKKRKILT